VYPHQADGWEPVHLSKLWAWALLVTVCFTPVAAWKVRSSAAPLPSE
jgi:uncharacterized membrane protein YoaT (DUF817 family)